MTAAESKTLQSGNRVYWRGDPADRGCITALTWDAVTIAWDNGQSQLPLRSCASAKNMSFQDAGMCFMRPTLCMNSTCFIRLAGAVV